MSTLLPEGQRRRERELLMLLELASVSAEHAPALLARGASVALLRESPIKAAHELGKAAALPVGARHRLAGAVEAHLHTKRPSPEAT